MHAGIQALKAGWAGARRSVRHGLLAALCAGLMAPYAARLLVGGAHAAVLTTAMMLGGCLVLVADAVARTAFAPIDVPVGVLTAIVGAPYLLWLLAGRAR